MLDRGPASITHLHPYPGIIPRPAIRSPLAPGGHQGDANALQMDVRVGDGVLLDDVLDGERRLPVQAQAHDAIQLLVTESPDGLSSAGAVAP